MTLEVHELPETPSTFSNWREPCIKFCHRNQWYDVNGMISGAVGQIYSPTVTGNYHTIVTNEYQCESDSSNIIFYQPTNIQEINSENGFNIYPNPAKDFINIEYLVNNDDDVTIEMYNAFGQRMDKISEYQAGRTRVGTIKLDVKLLNAGVYYIKVYSDEYSVTRKIILSK